MRGVYVTGTDTGIGKTVASTALLHALRARGLRAVGMKPVATRTRWPCSQPATRSPPTPTSTRMRCGCRSPPNWQRTMQA